MPADHRLDQLEVILGVTFTERDLLALALVHSSYPNENPAYTGGSNERLEFLGDAVIGLAVAQRLYVQFRDLPEGRLTALRADLVRGETLARIASRLSLGRFVVMGRGEEAAGARERPTVLAGTLEAVAGACWLDQGLDTVTDALWRWMEPEWQRVSSGEIQADPKTRLQHLIQGRLQQTPVYRVVSADGPDHAKRFAVEVLVGSRVAGRGVGSSKQAAEQDAARCALEAQEPRGA